MELNKEEHGQTHAEQKSQEEEVESLAEEPVESRWEYPRPGTYDLRQQLPQGGPRQRQALAGSDGTDYQKMIGRKKAEKIETQTEQQNWPQASPFGTVNCRASLKAEQRDARGAERVAALGAARVAGRDAGRVARRVRRWSEEEEGEKSYEKTTHEILRICDISHI